MALLHRDRSGRGRGIIFYSFSLELKTSFGIIAKRVWTRICEKLGTLHSVLPHICFKDTANQSNSVYSMYSNYTDYLTKLDVGISTENIVYLQYIFCGIRVIESM